MPGTSSIILFDGVCKLCSHSVQFVLQHDKKGVFKFIPLQSDTGQHLLSKHNLSHSIPLNSLVYLKGNKVYTRSDAVLKVAAQLSYPIKLLAIFIIVPKCMRDFLYRLVANNRYKIFSKSDVCILPQKLD